MTTRARIPLEVRNMNADSTQHCTYYRLSDALEGVIGWLSNPLPPTVSTGLSDLDSMLQGGLPLGKVSAVAGRPGMGRSEFARHVAFNTAKQGFGVLYFSLDQSKNVIALRKLAELFDVNLYWLLSRDNQAGVLEMLNKYTPELAALSELPIFIDDTPTLKPEELQDRIIAMCRLPDFYRNRVKLLVVDSLFSICRNLSNSADFIEQTMMMLVEMARSENIHILCTIPVLKQVEKRKSHQPRLFDLWGEGMIERYCDPILALYRDSYYYRPSETEESDLAHILILKNSMPGVTGAVIASFSMGRFGPASL